MVVGWTQKDEFDVIRAAIELGVTLHHQGGRSAPAAPSAPAADDPLEQIRKLGELRDAGLLGRGVRH